MRAILIVVILAAAGFIAWQLLNKGQGQPNDNDAENALGQIGKNQLEEQKLKNLDSFYQLENDECYTACKKKNCRFLFKARKCKGRCKTQCLQQLQTRYGIKDYNPLSA